MVVMHHADPFGIFQKTRPATDVVHREGAVAQELIATALSDDEFAAMMKEFDSARKWMRVQVALNRAASTSDILNPSRADAEPDGTAL